MILQRAVATPNVDHHLFTLRDPSQEWLGEFKATAENGLGLGVAPGVVVVQTLRAAGVVPVFIELHDGIPPDPHARYVYVETAAIVSAGEIVVDGLWSDLATPVSLIVPSGTYSVRVCHADLDTVTYDSDDGAEHYLVQIHPGSASCVRELDTDEFEEGPRRGPRGDEADVATLTSEARGHDELAACSALVALARAGEVEEVAAIASTASLPLGIIARNALRLVRARQQLEALDTTVPLLAHVRATALQKIEDAAESPLRRTPRPTKLLRPPSPLPRRRRNPCRGGPKPFYANPRVRRSTASCKPRGIPPT